MRFRIERDGDAIEQLCAVWIWEHLPNYSSIWGEFVGNDGWNRLPGQDALPPELAKLRAFVARWTYTTLESALGAYRVAEAARSIVIPPLTDAAAVWAYVDAMNALALFYAQVGRAFEALEKLAIKFEDKAVCTAVSDFYEQRHGVLHDAKLPTAVIDGALWLVPPMGHDQGDDTKWPKGQDWSKAEGMIPTPLSDLFDEVLREFLNRANDCLGRLRTEHLWPKMRPVADLLASLEPPRESSGTTTATTIVEYDIGGRSAPLHPQTLMVSGEMWQPPDDQQDAR